MDAMITYHQLRTFVTAVRTGSLTRAARELHLTQPSLSLQLRALTRYLDAPLFERHRGRRRLTPAGEKFRPYAEEALAGLLEQYPGIDLQLRVEFAEPLFGELSANALDVMCYINVPTPPGLTTELLCRDEFIVFASPRNPVAGRGRVTPRQLSQQPFVAPASP